MAVLKDRAPVRPIATPATTPVPLPELTPAQRQRGQRLMVYEGSLWAVMNALTMPGSLVLTAFALFLGADAFALGLISALPLLAALVQLWTPQLLARFGSRRRVTVLTMLFCRGLLLPMALIGLGAWHWSDVQIVWMSLFLVLLTVSAAFNAIGGTSWLSWAGSVVPVEQRSIYFARRNTILGVIGLVVTLAGGALLDWSKAAGAKPQEAHPLAFVALLMVAALFGLSGVYLLGRTPDLPPTPRARAPRFRDSLVATWRHTRLRQFLLFRAAWLFAVGIVVPYYTVYLLQNLHLSFTEVSALQNIGALAGLLTTPFWGWALEKLGCRRIIFWTSLAKSFYVVIWAFILPGQPFIPLVFLHATIFIDSGLNLAAGNLLMNLMPQEGTGNVGYLSVFTAVTSVVSAIGPFLAGFLISLLAGSQVGVLGIGMGAIQLAFLASGILRGLSLLLFRGIAE